MKIQPHTEETDKLEGILQTVVPSISIYYDITHTQGVGVCWSGYFHLDTFIEDLPKLKDVAPHICTYLAENYEGIIKDAKKLVARVKLQGLPIPCVEATYSSSSQYSERRIRHHIFEKPTNAPTRRSSVYGDNLIPKTQIKEGKYFDLVEPVIVSICVVITLTVNQHLEDVERRLVNKKT